MMYCNCKATVRSLYSDSRQQELRHTYYTALLAALFSGLHTSSARLLTLAEVDFTSLSTFERTKSLGLLELNVVNAASIYAHPSCPGRGWKRGCQISSQDRCSLDKHACSANITQVELFMKGN